MYKWRGIHEKQVSVESRQETLREAAHLLTKSLIQYLRVAQQKLKKKNRNCPFFFLSLTCTFSLLSKVNFHFCCFTLYQPKFGKETSHIICHLNTLPGSLFHGLVNGHFRFAGPLLICPAILFRCADFSFLRTSI